MGSAGSAASGRELQMPPLVISTNGRDLQSSPPRLTEVRPGRVHLLNKRYLLGAGPAFDFLFSLKRVVDVLVMLKPNRPVASVLSSKTRNQSGLMLLGSASHTISDAAIQNPRAAANDVHVIMVIALGRLTLPYRFARVAADPSNPRKPPSTWCRNQVLRCRPRGGRCRFVSHRRRADEPPLRSLAR
jgi:hypothetical protein